MDVAGCRLVKVEHDDHVANRHRVVSELERAAELLTQDVPVVCAGDADDRNPPVLTTRTTKYEASDCPGATAAALGPMRANQTGLPGLQEHCAWLEDYDATISHGGCSWVTGVHHGECGCDDGMHHGAIALQGPPQEDWLAAS